MKIDNKAVKSFVERWTGKGYEKGQSQIFWIELLTEVLGVKTPSEIISFEGLINRDDPRRLRHGERCEQEEERNYFIAYHCNLIPLIVNICCFPIISICPF